MLILPHQLVMITTRAILTSWARLTLITTSYSTSHQCSTLLYVYLLPQVFEVAPSVHLVELRKTGGDTLEFHKARYVLVYIHCFIMTSEFSSNKWTLKVAVLQELLFRIKRYRLDNRTNNRTTLWRKRVSLVHCFIHKCY